MEIDTPAHIAIFGGGPIGIEAGLYARYLGYDVQIFEREELASQVLKSSQKSSPFRCLRSTLGLAALAAQDPDFNLPTDEAELTGRGWVDGYLLPLSRTDLLADHILTGTRVVSVQRKSETEPSNNDEDRQASSFQIQVRSREGTLTDHEADVVIDVTGVTGGEWLGPAKEPDQTDAAHRSERATTLDPQPLITGETNYYILGAKSAGGDPHFAYATGLLQIRALFRILGGRADLDLYESVKNLLP